MSEKIYTIITGTGRYIPPTAIKNEHFLANTFFDPSGEKIDKNNREIIDKFLEITTIAERRYVTDDVLTSDIAWHAAREAIEDAGIDKEQLDYIIVAHNFGDIRPGNRGVDIVPSLASRVKQKLHVKNPFTIAYDVTFGCPGWIQGVIQADYYIRSGDAKKILVIGAEVLSRVADPHDRDCMLYADGAGAVVLEAHACETPTGILSHCVRSDTLAYAQMLYMGASYNPGNKSCNGNYIKMHGRKLYQYALSHVPQAIKICLEKGNLHLDDIHKILIHQANGKMDEAILKRLFTLYDKDEIRKDIMPMTISWLGNTSVATIPVLLDLMLKGEFNGQTIAAGDHLVFASVGAGMNINAVTYKMQVQAPKA